MGEKGLRTLVQAPRADASPWSAGFLWISLAVLLTYFGVVVRSSARPTFQPATSAVSAWQPGSISPFRGLASWYGAERQGRPTASGEPFDLHGLTAAHRTLPLGTWLEVRSPGTGKSVNVRVNDRGPLPTHVEIDLSYEAARQLGIAPAGVAEVEIQPVAAPGP